MHNLTPLEFEALLARLHPDRSRAAQEYELLRRKLAKFFERNHFLQAEELADETIDRVAGKLATDEIRDVGLFAYGVARMVCLEAGRRQGKIVPLQNDDPSGNPLAADRDPEAKIVEDLTNEKHLRCLRLCLQRLSDKHQRLIMEYYNGDKEARIQQRKDLAERLGIRMGALRSEANAVRDKLRRCVARCLQKTGGAHLTGPAIPAPGSGSQ